MNLLYSQPSPLPAPQIATVTYTRTGQYSAAAQGVHQGPPLFAPRGFSSLPCEGDQLLLLPVGGEQVCVGVESSTQNLQPGEVLISSTGGGKIHLKKDGSVVINGLTITLNGTLVPPTNTPTN